LFLTERILWRKTLTYNYYEYDDRWSII